MNTVVNLLLIAACAYAIFVLYVTHKWLKEHSESINILNETILRRLPKEEDDDEEEDEDDQGGEDNDVDDSARVSAEVHDEDKINS